MTNEEAIEKFGKPLTLEQLREMDGKPAFGVSFTNGKPGEWFIVRVVNMSKTWFIACSGASQGFGEKENYGEGWIAFAYPTAHIDRKAWEPCECCRSAKFMNGQSMYNFCPSCGRPMTDESWENLGKRLEGIK